MQLSRLCLTGALLSLTVSGVLAQRQPPAPSRVKALVGGLLVDGYAGPPIQNSVILIDGDKISAVGQVGRLAVPAGAEVISTEGMTVLPGLWDMHVTRARRSRGLRALGQGSHRSSSRSSCAAAKQLLLAGVTSARDLGGRSTRASTCATASTPENPRRTLYVAGPFIQHEPYQRKAYWGVKGPDEGRAKVKDRRRRRRRRG